MLRALAGTQECYQIKNSIALDADNGHYLWPAINPTGSRTTNTISMWVKRGRLGGSGMGLFSFSDGAVAPALTRIMFGFNADNTLYVVVQNSNTISLQKISNAVFRDTSAWYHFVFVLETTSAVAEDRCRVYVNGTRITLWGTNTNTIAQNDLTCINYWVSNSANLIGGTVYGWTGGVSDKSYWFDGEIAEFNWIDGQALGPEHFGRLCPISGEWEPIKYRGNYAGNYSCYYEFKDAGNLGADTSGKVRTASLYNGINSTSQMIDTPTNNFAVLNSIWPLGGGSKTYALGNTKVISGTSNSDNCASGSTLFIPPSLNVYAEFKLLDSSYDSTVAVGIPGAYWVKTGTAPMGTFAINDIIGVAYGVDGTVSFYKNGALAGSLTVANDGNKYFQISGAGNIGSVVWQANFGQRPFTYTPPAGFKTLCTRNLPIPRVQRPRRYFKSLLYTGSGVARAITDISNSDNMSPDLVWVKSRTTAQWHGLFDTVRGAGYHIGSNANAAQTYSADSLTQFINNGFNIGTAVGINESGANFVAWCWKKGITPGFDIIQFVGTGAVQNINHSLGVTPAMIIYKALNIASWVVMHKNQPDMTSYCVLLDGVTPTTLATPVNAPTSSQFSASQSIVPAGISAIAYLFAEVAGFSKFGAYAGNGSADGPFIYCGFRPAFIMIKRDNDATSNNWVIWDTKRDPANVGGNFIYPNLSNAESSASNFDVVSNGIKLRGTNADVNTNGAYYIFAAFAEMPQKYSNAR